MPTDDCDNSFYVDSAPDANHRKLNENINNPVQHYKVSEDDDGEYDNDNGESKDNDSFHSNQEEGSEATDEDDNTVIDAIILKTSVHVPNNSEISKNGNTSSNNNNNMIYINHPTSLVSDIEFASTKTNRRNSIIVNDQTFQRKFLYNMFMILSHRYLTSKFSVSKLPLQDDHPGKESILITMDTEMRHHIQVKATPMLATRYPRILITMYLNLSLKIQMIM